MNRSVFVTGAHDGTGFAIASRFAKEGYTVFIGSRKQEKAEEAAALMKREMEGCISLSVPLLAEVGIGKSWYDAK